MLFPYQARRNTPNQVDGGLAFAQVEEGGVQARTLAAELAETNAQLTRTNVDLANFIYTMLTTSVSPRDLARVQVSPIAELLSKPLTERKWPRY